MNRFPYLFWAFLFLLPPISSAKELPKIAVWDLVARNTPSTHAQVLTSVLVSEISKTGKYEVYSQENVTTLAGWTTERMRLGCTDTKCLTALGQMDIAKLVSGSVGRIGNTYSISLNLFDTQNAKAEKAVSDFCQTEDELIPLIQQTVKKILGIEIISPTSAPPFSPKPTLREEEAYKNAYSLYAKGDIQGAEWEFTLFLEAYPNSKYVQNAHFWLGECYFSSKNYKDAIFQYDEVIRKYPKGNQVPDALYRQAMAFLEMKDTTNTKMILKEVIRRFPQTDQATRARKKLEDLP